MSVPRELVVCGQNGPFSVVVELPAGTAALFTARSPAKTTLNEDAAALLPWGAEGAILAVADGVGGERGGAEAARICVATLAAGAGGARTEETPLRTTVLDAIERANATIAERANGGATTVAVVAIERHVARPIHVGDSAILVTGQRGRIKHQSIPHGPVGYAIEAGMLDEREALHHEDRNVVSNVVGSAEMRIEVGPRIVLARHDTVVLASDGLSDNLFVDEIAELARKGPLETACTTLAGRCGERMAAAAADRPHKPDDLTLIVFRRRS